MISAEIGLYNNKLSVLKAWSYPHVHCVQGPQRGKTLELPPNCPSIAKYLFEACTQMNPDNRPTASKIVEWLRQS